MDIRKIHFPTVGVIGLIIGGLLRAFTLIFSWPIFLVVLSQVVLLIALCWIVLFDLFPIFLEPFYYIRQRFSRRRTLFLVLLSLFIVFRAILDYLPSGPGKDLVSTLTFLLFLSAVGWFLIAYVLSNFTPLVKYMKRKPRDVEKITTSDIGTSMAIVFIPTIILSFIFAPTGLGQATVTPYQEFVISLLTDIAMAAYLYLFIIRPKVFTWRQLGLRKVGHEDIRKALSLFVGVSLLVILAHHLLNIYGITLEAYSFTTHDGALLAAIALVIIAPFVEELYFRGFLFRGLSKSQPEWVAYWVSSLLFALLHPPLILMLEFLIIGLLLAYILKETKSIWPGVFIHALNNALIVAYLLYR